MSQLNKVLQVLDVFTEERPFATAEEVGMLLGIPRTTAFRYLGQLCESGLVSNMSGRYALGARIIQLDYLMRRNDPLIGAARGPMGELATATRCTIVLSGLYGAQVVNVHEERGLDTAALSYGRGRSLPLFRGAASKVIVANMPPARLKALYEAHRGDPDVIAIGKDWPSFAEAFRRIRRQGHYISHGEVDEGLIGISAPLSGVDGHVAGCLSAVFDAAREGLLRTELLSEMVMAAASRISQSLAALRAEEGRR